MGLCYTKEELSFTHQSKSPIWQLALGYCLLALAGCGSDNTSGTTNGQAGGAAPQTIALKTMPSQGQIDKENAKARETMQLLVSPRELTAADQRTAYPFEVTAMYTKQGLRYAITGQDLAIPGFIVNRQTIVPQPEPIPPNFNGYPIPVIFPTESFRFNGYGPRFDTFEYVNLNPQLTDELPLRDSTPLVDGGILLTITNTQTHDSFTVGGGKPTGANVTYAFDNTYVTNGTLVRKTYLGTATFADGWKVGFHSDDTLLPAGTNPAAASRGQKSEVNLSFGPPMSSASVTIDGFTASPSTFNPNSETTTFQAGIIASGFSNNATLNWTLTPDVSSSVAPATLRTNAVSGGEGGDISLAPIFSGTSDISSGVANITQSWDGKSSSGQVLAVRDYPYNLNVAVVDSNGRSETATANTTVTLSTSPTMRVDSGEGSQLAIAVPPANQDPLFFKQDNAFKKQVFPYKAGQTAPWNVSTSGIRFQLEPGQPTPEKLTVRVQSSVSLANQTIELDRESEGTYSGHVPLTNALIKPDPENTTTYTTVTAIGTSSSDFVQLMQSSAATAVYPNPRNSLGDFLGLMLNPDATARNMQVPPTVENVRSGGFEAVNVSLLKSDNGGKLIDELNTVIYVRHPAKVCYVNSHGSHTGVLNLADDFNMLRRMGGLPPLAQQNLAPGSDFSDPNVLDTLILNSCDSLDIYDYNNANIGREGRRLPTDPIALRPAPGLTWHHATVKDSGHYPALLGFNTPAAEFSQPGLIAFWGQELGRLSSDPRSRVLAWMVANYKTGIGKGTNIVPSDIAFASGFQDASLRAAALDDHYYYYIPCRYNGKDKQITMPNPTSALGVYRVNLDDAIPGTCQEF